MWLVPLYIILVSLLVYLTAATLYVLVAVAYFVVREPRIIESTKFNRFAILVPAHNEELLISHLCENLLKINYPRQLYEIFIIADNCNDRTTECCRTYPINILSRNDLSRIGKGFALSWALERIGLEDFNAILMVDADTFVDSSVLEELNKSINRGEQVIQCYIKVPNRNESWFTQLLFVARMINGLLYHQAKYKLGLSSYLMGSGMCFESSLLRDKGWTAFSIGEDWEYYAQLIKERIKIGFAVRAEVFQQESRSLNQATSQRLRWSSGRFDVLKNLGFQLFLTGLIKRDWFILDASLPLIFPNYSLQINLTIITLVLCLFLPSSATTALLLALTVCLFFCQAMVFLAGIYLAGNYWEVGKAILHAPVFLVWKSVIDFLSVTGIYRRKKWVRTERHLSHTKN